MSHTHPTDVHAPYVRQLDEAGHWAALVRYWLAHQHGPALDAAIVVVLRRQEATTERWRELAEFLAQVRAEPSTHAGSRRRS